MTEKASDEILTDERFGTLLGYLIARYVHRHGYKLPPEHTDLIRHDNALRAKVAELEKKFKTYTSDIAKEAMEDIDILPLDLGKTCKKVINYALTDAAERIAELEGENRALDIRAAAAAMLAGSIKADVDPVLRAAQTATTAYLNNHMAIMGVYLVKLKKRMDNCNRARELERDAKS